MNKRIISLHQIDKQPIRDGLTTGACAQAAAKACALMLLQGKVINSVEIELPGGKVSDVKVMGQNIGLDFACCGVRKDAGSDHTDVTHGLEIFCQITKCPKKGVNLRAGEGIGRVTKPGLPVPVGDYAINPVPRRMILKEITALFPNEEGVEVEISVPRGEEIATKTFNPKIGVMGGISILGTTGVV